MNLHGYPVTAGDFVHDLVDGPLRVVDVEAAVFTVRMANGQYRKYNSDGKLTTRKYPTAYWQDPVILKPHKDAVVWSVQRRYIEQAAALLKAQADLLERAE